MPVMILAFRVQYLCNEREYSYRKCITLFILTCCFNTVFIPIRIMPSDSLFGSTVHSFLLIDILVTALR